MSTIEEVCEDDFASDVEFDLLSEYNTQDANSTNNSVHPYIDFKVFLGSVHSAKSSHTIPVSSATHKFDMIIDSGCTCHMMPQKDTFITYKDCPNAYVILADKSKVPCLGTGTIQITLLDKNVILRDVLHVPSLCSPLLSIWYFCRLSGCSFIADNTGIFLTFPTFFLPVDDSSDCIIPGSTLLSTSNLDFDSRLVGSAAPVSDNTHH